MKITSNYFKYTIDTRHFHVKSVVNGNKAEPVATIRKTDGGAVLIFFADEVAAELKRWRPQAVVNKSGTTNRYYSILDESCLPKDIPSKNFVRSAIHKAFRAISVATTADEVPIRELEFALVEDQYMFDRLRIELRNICGMAGKYTAYKQQKVAYYSSGQELTAATKLSIKRVIFNGPATIVMWNDGSKTVVKRQPGEVMDAEKGIFAACAKKLLGTNETGSNYLEQIKPILMEQCCYISNEEAKKIVGTLDKEEN